MVFSSSIFAFNCYSLAAEKFASRYCSEVPSEHTSEAAELKESLTSMHTLPKSVVDKYRSVLCHVPLSNVAFKHLLQFLQVREFCLPLVSLY